jgi:hypothetical protein
MTNGPTQSAPIQGSTTNQQKGEGHRASRLSPSFHYINLVQAVLRDTMDELTVKYWGERVVRDERLGGSSLPMIDSTISQRVSGRC